MTNKKIAQIEPLLKQTFANIMTLQKIITKKDRKWAERKYDKTDDEFAGDVYMLGQNLMDWGKELGGGDW